MARSILWVSGLLLAAVSAGCLGGGDSQTNSVSTSTQTNVGNTTLSGSASIGPGGGNVSGNVSDPSYGDVGANATWSTEERTGSVSGTGVPGVAGPFESEESFTVANGTMALAVNLTVEGDEVTLYLRGPDCQSNDCAESAATQGGVASITVDNPQEGPWTAVVSLGGNGPVQADYTMQIAQKAPGGMA